MIRYLQLHFLLNMPGRSPERDPWGRPKTATFGGVPRLRLSSQWLGRTLCQSDPFHSRLSGHLGFRTRRIGEEVRRHLLGRGASERDALGIARDVAAVFGTVDEAASRSRPAQVRYRRLLFVSPCEKEAAFNAAERMLAGAARPPEPSILRAADGCADLALFGRTLPGRRVFDRRAAADLSHALSTHRRGEDTAEACTVLYLYACIDPALLVHNLDGDRALAQRTLATLVEALATALPSGPPEHAPRRACTSYLRAEAGSAPPRNLAVAFLEAVTDPDRMSASVHALERAVAHYDHVYGPCAEACAVWHVEAGRGELAAITDFVDGQAALA